MAARQSEMPAGMLVPQLGAWLGDWDQEWDGTLALGIHLLIQDFWWERGKKGLTKVLIRGTVLNFESLIFQVCSLIPKVCNTSEPSCYGERVTSGKQMTPVSTTFYAHFTKKGLFFFQLHILWCFIEQNGDLWFKLHILFTSQSFLPKSLAERLSSLLNYLL